MPHRLSVLPARLVALALLLLAAACGGGGGGTAVAAPGAPDTRAASTTDARAFWLTRQLIQWPGLATGAGTVRLHHAAAGGLAAPLDGVVSGADGALTLEPHAGALPEAVAARFKWIAPGPVFRLKDADLPRLPELLRGQLVLVLEDAAGRVQAATTAQLPGALDDLYAAAADAPALGATISAGRTRFGLWAPTAQAVSVRLFDGPTGAASAEWPAAFDAATGVWRAEREGDLSGRYYQYVVRVFVRGTGRVDNVVTDPYSVSLNADSQRSYIADLAAPALKPAGWDASAVPARVAAAPDMVVYELHLRDFSINDASVSAANRGKYLAFTEAGSNGMKHLKALSDAGLTDVHLLPVFDIASVPEAGCVTPAPAGAADAETQQAAVAASAATDCYNWGYDPWHFNAPEGSYASSAADGAARILEFRRMVMGLHAAGLRVGMDVVYNHTTASGQHAKSVLDRIVPGYYQRLDAVGAVTNSTCCDNTATEHTMMARLMIDSAVLWAREYRIASFRFDLMGHQPREAMLRLQAAVNAATGRTVPLFGEGWNYGEVADGARFVQAAQGRLGGTGIGTFGDRLRDAVRGGGCCDSGQALLASQGWINGLVFAPNAQAQARGVPGPEALRQAADVVRGALAGSIASYTMQMQDGRTLPLSALGTGGVPLGYALQPGEVVNYVENHDNPTLFDINALRLPAGTSREDRARVQLLGAAIVALAQGTAYFHAGVDTLRSKSLDRNSFDSGDWFNRLDWTYADNHFGTGLPPRGDNGADWGWLRPVLADASIKPEPPHIAWMRDAFRDLLRIRAGSTLLRLRTADDVKARLTFHDTGPAQVPTLVAASLDGRGYPGAGFSRLAYFINAGLQAQTLAVPALVGAAWRLHPVQAAAGAADRRVATGATVNAAAGAFTVPARSVAVFVVD